MLSLGAMSLAVEVSRTNLKQVKDTVILVNKRLMRVKRIGPGQGGWKMANIIPIQPVGYARYSRVAAQDDGWDGIEAAIELEPRFGPEALAKLCAVLKY
jgi:hypothetical protein